MFFFHEPPTPEALSMAGLGGLGRFFFWVKILATNTLHLVL